MCVCVGWVSEQRIAGAPRTTDNVGYFMKLNALVNMAKTTEMVENANQCVVRFCKLHIDHKLWSTWFLRPPFNRREPTELPETMLRMRAFELSIPEQITINFVLFHFLRNGVWSEYRPTDPQRKHLKPHSSTCLFQTLIRMRLAASILLNDNREIHFATGASSSALL